MSQGGNVLPAPRGQVIINRRDEKHSWARNHVNVSVLAHRNYLSSLKHLSASPVQKKGNDYKESLPSIVVLLRINPRYYFWDFSKTASEHPADGTLQWQRPPNRNEHPWDLPEQVRSKRPRPQTHGTQKKKLLPMMSPEVYVYVSCLRLRQVRAVLAARARNL